MKKPLIVLGSLVALIGAVMSYNAASVTHSSVKAAAGGDWEPSIEISTASTSYDAGSVINSSMKAAIGQGGSRASLEIRITHKNSIFHPLIRTGQVIIDIGADRVAISRPGLSGEDLKDAVHFTATASGIDVAVTGVHVVTIPYPAR
jgi:hypothetical protein